MHDSTLDTRIADESYLPVQIGTCVRICEHLLEHAQICLSRCLLSSMGDSIFWSSRKACLFSPKRGNYCYWAAIYVAEEKNTEKEISKYCESTIVNSLLYRQLYRVEQSYPYTSTFVCDFDGIFQHPKLAATQMSASLKISENGNSVRTFVISPSEKSAICSATY